MSDHSSTKNPIGVFDSGYGGLTILKELTKQHPQYDYIYLGDNARAPYGTRSFETVYEYTLQCVKKLFEMGCPLVILACNTASAKALRTIQQKDLNTIGPEKRVLGVIRPTTEVLGHYTQSKEVGIFATSGTVSSNSYAIEIEKFFPDIKVHQEACPMWVSLVENHESESAGADFFIEKHVNNLFAKSKNIDTIVLGCTHYPLLVKKIKKFLPEKIKILSQGEIVAKSLGNYLQRHAEMESRISKNGIRKFFTTEIPENFNHSATFFYGEKVNAEKIIL
jgi:glutamate racemase